MRRVCSSLDTSQRKLVGDQEVDIQLSIAQGQYHTRSSAMVTNVIQSRCEFPSRYVQLILSDPIDGHQKLPPELREGVASACVDVQRRYLSVDARWGNFGGIEWIAFNINPILSPIL